MSTFSKVFFRNALLASLTVLFIPLSLNEAGAAPQPAPGEKKPALSAPPAPGVATPQASTGEVVAVTAPAALKATPTAEDAAPKSGALTYQAPLNAQSSVEVSIEKLTLKSEELPESISMASIAKMKTNPHIATSQNDFAKIAKEAFKNRIQYNNWRVVHTTFYANREGQDDTLYILISIEYKKDMNPEIFKKDMSAIKQYLKKETSDEYILLEKFPFVLILAANQIGDYEFATVKELGERLKFKLYGTTDIAPVPVVYDTPGTAEVSTPAPANKPAPEAGKASAQPEKKEPAKTETVKTEVIREDVKAPASSSTAIARETVIKEDAKTPASTSEIKTANTQAQTAEAVLTTNKTEKPAEKDAGIKTTVEKKAVIESQPAEKQKSSADRIKELKQQLEKKNKTAKPEPTGEIEEDITPDSN
ncbi:MAG TPA: hypothetical protein PKK26_01720 [Candidatus Wallbacteria bacterium]|nr:hypothetical protein [Candidatus Wallbacteria bacterium]